MTANDLLRAIATRWQGLGVSDYAWLTGWLREVMATTPAPELLQQVSRYVRSDLPDAADLALMCSRIRRSTNSDGSRADRNDPDCARGTLPSKCDQVDVSGARPPMLFIAHDLINSAICTDDALLVWLILARIPGSHLRMVTCNERVLFSALGWHDLTTETARRRLRRAVASLVKVGAVRVQVGHAHNGVRRREYQRLMVPTHSHRGRFERVAAKLITEIANTIGSSGLRHWLRWASVAAGRRYVSQPVKTLASRWGVSPSSVVRYRRRLAIAGLLTITSGDGNTSRTEVAGLDDRHLVPSTVVPQIRSAGSTAQAQECPLKEQHQAKTKKDILVASATLETQHARAAFCSVPPASPATQAAKPMRTSADVRRARQILWQLPDFITLEPRLRGQCYAKLTGLLRVHGPALADNAPIVQALRTRFIGDVDVQRRHCQMIMEAVGGVLSDQKAELHTTRSAPTQTHGVPQQTDSARAFGGMDPLQAAAAAGPDEPDWRNPNASTYGWILTLLARRLANASCPKTTLAALSRAVDTHLSHDSHRAELAAAVAYVAQCRMVADHTCTDHRRIDVEGANRSSVSLGT